MRGMMLRKMALLVVALALLPGHGLALAQGGETPEPVEVTLEAADGLLLVGDYYAAAPQAGEEAAPAVLLLHMLGSARIMWRPLVPALAEAGYAVLAVDMRGHGETRGARDWPLAEQDVQAWLDWLRAQEGIDPARLNIVGASIGANLALRGMANDAEIVTAVALSPGLDYQGVTTEDALATIAKRPVYLVVGQRDRSSAESVRALAGQLAGAGMARFFDSFEHGTSLLLEQDTLAPSIVGWLEWHNR
ncbi:MAG: alpha/beta fold hydrolase [Anaerolineae bacterium]|nr:alpha/beta fold hydrolase [Anaerolineae bacterium]